MLIFELGKINIKRKKFIKTANLREIPQNCGELKFSKNRESVKSADIETADIGDPLYVVDLDI